MKMIYDHDELKSGCAPSNRWPSKNQVLSPIVGCMTITDQNWVVLHHIDSQAKASPFPDLRMLN